MRSGRETRETPHGALKSVTVTTGNDDVSPGKRDGFEDQEKTELREEAAVGSRKCLTLRLGCCQMVVPFTWLKGYVRRSQCGCPRDTLASLS